MGTTRPHKYIRTRILLFGTYLLHLLLFGLGRIFLRRVSMEIRGAENLRTISNGAVFAPNHTSILDPLILCIALARSHMLSHILPLVSVAREKSFYKGMAYPQPYMYGGTWFKLLGALEVTPRSAQDQKHGTEDVLALHATLLEKGFSVLIFPEGHITRDGKLLTPKLGAAKLSQRTQTPLVPVAINGAFELNPWQLITGRAHVTVTFIKPLCSLEGTRDLSDQYYIGISTTMMGHIEQTLKGLS